LQNRILELQERIAVAIQVDEAKDKAILRFHDSWEKAGIKLQDIEKQKERLEDEIDKLRKKLSDDSDETNQVGWLGRWEDVKVVCVLF
jgi:predicted  nucleic acid-binding Zn-ribbon protein